MIYLKNCGISVVGVEFNENAILNFFQENNLKFEKREATPLPYYKTISTSGNEEPEIRIYCGDLFKFRSIEKFDLIWDRGSMVAINPDDRARYATLLSSLLSNRGTILVEALKFGQNSGNSDNSDNSENFDEISVFKTVGPPGAPYNLVISHLENIYLNHQIKILSNIDWDHPLFGNVTKSYIQIQK